MRNARCRRDILGYYAVSHHVEFGRACPKRKGLLLQGPLADRVDDVVRFEEFVSVLRLASDALLVYLHGFRLEVEIYAVFPELDVEPDDMQRVAAVVYPVHHRR